MTQTLLPSPLVAALPSVGSRVRQARRAAGWTQIEMGRRTELGALVAAIELGRTEPKLSALNAIAQATGVSVEWLITGAVPASNLGKVSDVLAWSLGTIEAALDLLEPCERAAAVAFLTDRVREMGGK